MDYSRRDFLALGTAAGLSFVIEGRRALASVAGEPADIILRNGKFATMDRARPLAAAVAIREGKFAAVGSEQEVLRHKGPQTRSSM